MARTKGALGKKNRNNNPPPVASAESDLNLNESSADEIDLNIEPNTTESDSESVGFMDRLKNITSGLASDEVEEKKPAKKSKKTPDEFNALVVALITLGTSLSIPEPYRPINDEIQIFSNHLSGILARHLSISGKLSADALDIMGLVVCTSMYYARISPQIKEARQTKKINRSPEVKESINDLGNGFGEVRSNEPIVKNLVPPTTQAWLKKAEDDAINNANNRP